MAALTQEEKQYAMSLLKHSLVTKLFDEMEMSYFNDAVFAKPHETDKINSALGEVRAVQQLRRKLQLLEAVG
jgi:hypothetical protein